MLLHGDELANLASQCICMILRVKQDTSKDPRIQDLRREDMPLNTRLLRQMLACRNLATGYLEWHRNFTGSDRLEDMCQSHSAVGPAHVRKYGELYKFDKDIDDGITIGIKLLVLEKMTGMRSAMLMLHRSASKLQRLSNKSLRLVAVELQRQRNVRFETWSTQCIEAYGDGMYSGTCAPCLQRLNRGEPIPGQRPKKRKRIPNPTIVEPQQTDDTEIQHSLTNSRSKPLFNVLL